MNPNPNVKPETGPAESWEQWSQRPGAPDEVCRALANGSTLLRWTATHDFDHYSVWHWLRTNPECAEQYKGLADFRMDRLLDEMLELADDSSQDFLTDEKGKVSVNRAHFTRTRIQLDTRKCILRQLTTARRLAKDEKPQWSYEDEILKLGNDDTPYDPTGLISATKPAYNPGPPPLSRPASASQSAIRPPQAAMNSPRPLGGEGAQRAGEGVSPTPASIRENPCNPCPPSQSAIRSPQAAMGGLVSDVPAQAGSSSETQDSVTHHASRTTFSHQASGTTPGEQSTTTNNQQITGERTFPSYRAYLRAIWESGWVEGTPLPFVYRPTPDASLPNPTPNPSLLPAPTPVLRPLGGEGAQRADEGVGSTLNTDPLKTDYSSSQSLPPVPTTKQGPQAMVGGGVPKIDWFGLLGMRKVSAFLMLFFLLLATTAANLHASIHSLSVPIGEHQEQSNFYPPSTQYHPLFVQEKSHSPFAFIRVNSWLKSLPASAAIRNPAAHSRRSRDAPSFPLNTEH